MKIYDAYITVQTDKNDVSANTAERADIVKIQNAIAEISKNYNVKTDICLEVNTDIDSVFKLRKAINSSMCSVIIVRSADINGFMIPIIHTISKNKKLCVLILNDKNKNVQTVITSDGYENMTVSDRASNADYFDILSSFISSAKKETRQLCVNCV